METRGYSAHGHFHGTETKSEKSRVPPPKVFSTGASHSGYLEQPQQTRAYNPSSGTSNFGYAPDHSFPNVHNQFPTQQGYPPVTQQPNAMQSSSNTTVIVRQQTPTIQVQGPRGWSTGMCECCADMGICLCVWCCSECYACCCFMNQVNESCCFPCCFPGSWMGAVRTKIRTKYNIQGSMMGDFCLTCGCCVCCTRYCVFCQMAREVKLMEQQGNPI